MVNKLLLNEYPLLILPSLAEAIGLNEAIILQQIHYWLRTFKQANNQRHHQDGRWWVWNSVREWQSNFPFWSEATIRRALLSLRSSYPPDGQDKDNITKTRRGPLLTATPQYNKKRYDKTLWYTINYNEVATLERAFGQNDQRVSKAFGHFDQMDLVKMTKRLGQNDQMDLVKMTKPIPETTIDYPEITRAAAAEKSKQKNNSSNNHYSTALREYEKMFGVLGGSLQYERFGDLWDEFPQPDIHEYARQEMYKAMMRDENPVSPNVRYYAKCLETGNQRNWIEAKEAKARAHDEPDRNDPEIQKWLKMHKAGTLPYHKD